MKIGFVTCQSLPELDKDSQLVYDYLKTEKKENVDIIIWTDDSVDYKDFSMLIIKSPWDYCDDDKYEKFKLWLQKIKQNNIKLYNPVDLISWNSHKKYLVDLEAFGVAVIPTLFFEKRTSLDVLKQNTKSKKWKKFVFKPCVGNGSKGVFLVESMENLTSEKEQEIIQLSASNDFLIQEFQSSIFEGEISLIYFQGKFSHAVLRQVAMKDEFRQGDDFKSSLYEHNQKLVDLGDETIQKVAQCSKLKIDEILYARIDVMKQESNNNEYYISEIELFEPNLFFSLSKESIEKYTQSVLSLKE